MTDKSRIICSITAFLFLALFVSIKYLPATLVLQLYIIATHQVAITTMILLMPIMVYLSITDKDFGYSLLLIIFMAGQVMFEHVYADNYQLAVSSNIEKVKKTKVHHYDPNWNKA